MLEPAAAVLEARRELEVLRVQLAELEAELGTLDADAASAIENALAAVEQARHTLQACQAEHARASDALLQTRSELDTQRGVLVARRTELERFDTRAVQVRVAECARELEQYAGDVPFTPEEAHEVEQAVESARRTFDQATRELEQARGALSHIGGNAAAEDLRRVEEAIERAKQQERALEIEAESWQLLRDTLREVENDQGSHLGRALAAPLTARFVEVTHARYEGLRLDAHLTAESVLLPGGTAQKPTALSVGTREQLATLLRLTIAEQLRSAVILDDHLVQTDPVRLLWFGQALPQTGGGNHLSSRGLCGAGRASCWRGGGARPGGWDAAGDRSGAGDRAMRLIIHWNGVLRRLVRTE